MPAAKSHHRKFFSQFGVYRCTPSKAVTLGYHITRRRRENTITIK